MQDQGDTEAACATIREYEGARRRTLGQGGEEDPDLKFPGTDKPMTLLYLHCGEMQDAYFAARAHYEKKAQSVDDVAAPQFQLELEYQQAFRMLLQPGAGNPSARLFKSVDEVRRDLTPNECSFIIDHHFEKQLKEGSVWAGAQGNLYIRQLARLLDRGEDTDPDELLAMVAALRTRDELGTSVDGD